MAANNQTGRTPTAKEANATTKAKADKAEQRAKEQAQASNVVRLAKGLSTAERKKLEPAYQTARTIGAAGNDEKTVREALGMVVQGNKVPTVTDLLYDLAVEDNRVYNAPVNMALEPILVEQLRKLSGKDEAGIKKWLHEEDEKGKLIKAQLDQEKNSFERTVLQRRIGYMERNLVKAVQLVKARDDAEANGFYLHIRNNSTHIRVFHVNTPGEQKEFTLDNFNRLKFAGVKTLAALTGVAKAKRKGKNSQKTGTQQGQNNAQQQAPVVTALAAAPKAAEAIATVMSKSDVEAVQKLKIEDKSKLAIGMSNMIMAFTTDDMKDTGIRADLSEICVRLLKLLGAQSIGDVEKLVPPQQRDGLSKAPTATSTNEGKAKVA